MRTHTRQTRLTKSCAKRELTAFTAENPPLRADSAGILGTQKSCLPVRDLIANAGSSSPFAILNLYTTNRPPS